MYLFQVTRWGNDNSPDGANGEDTHFLVAANNYREAAALADEQLARMPHERCAGYCNVVAQLGLDQGQDEQPRIVLGPCVQYAFNGKEYPNYWVRHYLDWDWIHASEHELG